MGQECGCYDAAADQQNTLDDNAPSKQFYDYKKGGRKDQESAHDREMDKLGIDKNSMRAEQFIKRRFKNFNDKYDRGRLLGRGAFGQVFECWIKGTGGREEKFALKILKKSLLSQKPNIDDLLVNEFKVLMDAKHPHIVRMYDIFQDVKNFYVVQELLVGGDLYNALQTTTFSEEDTITIITQTLLALKFLHDQNIVHRDIKSDNILLLKNEQKRGRIVVKICDFGLSSYIDPNIGGLQGFAGTPEYMAPEVILQPGNKTEIRSRQADAKKVPVITQKADVFAMGVLTYELLTSKTAFHYDCKSSLKLYNAILNKEPRYKEAIFHRVNPDCIDFINQCLIKDQFERPSVTDILRHPWLNRHNQVERDLASRTAFLDSNLRANIDQSSKQVTFSGSSKGSHQRKKTAAWKRVLIQKMTWLKQSQDRFLQYSEVFKSINVSQTGYITIKELEYGIQNLQGGQKDNINWQAVFQNMDTNNDGIIDYQEFIMACSSYENIINEKNVRELFESIDLNGDGQIQMGELQAMFQEEQLSATGVGTGATAGNDEKAIWIQIMEEMDSTGSRTISYPEFSDSLFMVLQRNLDEVSPVLKSSYRASICIDGS